MEAGNQSGLYEIEQPPCFFAVARNEVDNIGISSRVRRMGIRGFCFLGGGSCLTLLDSASKFKDLLVFCSVYHCFFFSVLDALSSAR